MRLLRAAKGVVTPKNELLQLKGPVQKHLAGLHEAHRTLDEHAFYPAHNPRTESSAYTRMHRTMTIAEDLPCRICDVRESTLRSRVHNVYGAITT